MLSVLVGETSIAEDRTRPDDAVAMRNALVGFIEVKAPGKGANPKAFREKHDKTQWERLKSLPNLIYTDGNSFSLRRDGERSGDIVRLEGDVESSGDMIETVVPQMTRWLPEEEAELIRKAFGQALAV